MYIHIDYQAITQVNEKGDKRVVKQEKNLIANDVLQRNSE